MDEFELRPAGKRLALLCLIFAIFSYSERSEMLPQHSYYKPADRRIQSAQFPPAEDDEPSEETNPQADLELAGDGRSVSVAGRTVKCRNNIRVSLNSQVPSEGVAHPGGITLNPRLLRRQPAMVQLFIFYHECGHHHIGGQEEKADCWAATRGVSEKWLEEQSIDEICSSFGRGNRPSEFGHPGARDRCQYLRSCYDAAVAKYGPVNPQTETEPDPAPARSEEIATRQAPAEVVNLPGMTIIYKGVR